MAVTQKMTVASVLLLLAVSSTAGFRQTGLRQLLGTCSVCDTATPAAGACYNACHYGASSCTDTGTTAPSTFCPGAGDSNCYMPACAAGQLRCQNSGCTAAGCTLTCYNCDGASTFSACTLVAGNNIVVTAVAPGDGTNGYTLTLNGITSVQTLYFKANNEICTYSGTDISGLTVFGQYNSPGGGPKVPSSQALSNMAVCATPCTPVCPGVPTTIPNLQACANADKTFSFDALDTGCGKICPSVSQFSFTTTDGVTSTTSTDCTVVVDGTSNPDSSNKCKYKVKCSGCNTYSGTVAWPSPCNGANDKTTYTVTTGYAADPTLTITSTCVASYGTCVLDSNGLPTASTSSLADAPVTLSFYPSASLSAGTTCPVVKADASEAVCVAGSTKTINAAQKTFNLVAAA